MTYKRTQNEFDRACGIFRVMDICFEDNASDNEIEEVISEVSNMNVVGPALMTREALCLCIKAPKYVSERMVSMQIGTSFKYNGVKITRWSKHTYNGMAI